MACREAASNSDASAIIERLTRNASQANEESFRTDIIMKLSSRSLSRRRIFHSAATKAETDPAGGGVRLDRAFDCPNAKSPRQFQVRRSLGAAPRRGGLFCDVTGNLVQSVTPGGSVIAA
jgi:hypothetical protein